jgi:peptide/nickel transport system substrate-binding protein
MEQRKPVAPGLVFTPTTRLNFTNVHFNVKRKPWDNPRLRQAVSLALDRHAMIRTVFQGGAQRGGVNGPPPDGNWGLPEEELKDLPGYGDFERSRQQAREIMRDLGYGETNRLKYILSTRVSPVYVEPATFTIAALKDVYMDGELKQFESGQWYGVVARRDYTVAVNSTGVSADDPDVNFYENFTCNSIRNYSDYCNPAVEKLIDTQSQEFDTAKRKKLVWEIDKRLVTDGARIILAFRINYNAMWPHVKNLIPHANQYTYGRMQEVWLDR